jgi:proteasome beta subunit
MPSFNRKPKLDEEQEKHLKGTTTVGILCRDGVVLATDTRATAGYLVASKVARKIYPITKHIAFTTAGGVADTQLLVDLMRAEARYYQVSEGAPMPVGACARMLANILNAYSFIPLVANLLVGGVDRDGPRLYFLDLDGGLTEEEMVATGSGSPVAYGLLESEFRPKMKIKDILPCAIRAVKMAMRRDIATGNEVMVATVTREGYRELSPAEIKRLA